MKIDIHRHAHDRGNADQMIRNLFHDQTDQLDDEHYYSVGLHPWHVDQDSLMDDLEAVTAIAHHPQILAIGEAGLDKSIKTSLKLQTEAFEQQIAFAVKYEKPMIIHCVKAYNEVFDLKRNTGYDKAWIIHWYNASGEMGIQLSRHGFYLSFGHMLFNENSKAFHAFKGIPLQHIFLETDDSEYTIDKIYSKAAYLRNIPVSDLEAQLEKNFHTCFGIHP